jgi:hypothetical protein
VSYHLIVSSRKIVPWKGKVCQYNLTGEAGNLSTICAEKGYFSGGSKQRSVMPAAQLQLPWFAGPGSAAHPAMPSAIGSAAHPAMPSAIGSAAHPAMPSATGSAAHPAMPSATGSQPIPPCHRPPVRSPSRHAIGHRFAAHPAMPSATSSAAHPAMPSAIGSASHPQGVALLYTAASQLALAVRL